MDWLDQHHISSDVLLEIGKKLHLLDLISLCNSSHYFRSRVCMKSFWREYLRRNYPGIVLIDDPEDEGPNYTKYSSSEIIELVSQAREEHPLNKFFPRVDPSFFRDLLKEYAQNIFDYLAYAFDLTSEESIEDYIIVDLEDNTRVEGKPVRSYLRIGSEGRIVLVSALEVTLTSFKFALQLSESGIIIGETPINPKGSPKVVYSSQMTLEDLDEVEEVLDLPHREKMPEINPNDSPEEIMKLFLESDPHGGVFIPLGLESTTHQTKGYFNSSSLVSSD